MVASRNISDSCGYRPSGTVTKNNRQQGTKTKIIASIQLYFSAEVGTAMES